jgi:Domain of unknown function (DUF4258)
MGIEQVIFRAHAILRMFERRISVEDVLHVLEAGEVIEDYPTDTPYPSQLILGWRMTRPLHIVVANNAADKQRIVITVYEPGADQWEHDFKRRKP